MASKTLAFLLALSGLSWALFSTSLPAESYEELRAEAELRFAEGSYELAFGIYEEAARLELDDEQRCYLETAQQSADLLLGVIGNILDFSKIEAGKLELAPVEFDVRDWLCGALTTMAARAEDKGLDLVYEVSPQVPAMAFGDSGRLRQVVSNLVDNAVKFTTEGRVSITADVDLSWVGGDALHLSVEDTGSGIPAHLVDTIFESFTQVDGSLTREHGGSGLGLAICRRLIDEMGGRIWVEAAAGPGSTFHFVVPIIFGGGDDDTLQLPEALNGRTAILIGEHGGADDLLAAQLSRRGVETAVGNAVDAVQVMRRAAARGAPFSLLLLAMDRSIDRGLEIARQVRRDSTCGDPGMVAIFSPSRGDVAARFLDLGLVGLVTRPVNPAMLLNTMADALAQPGLMEDLAEASQRGQAPSGGVRKKILVAEDNEVNRLTAVAMLNRLGHEVVSVDTGKLAVDAVRENGPFDLILMDCEMPVMDGYDATTAIRNLSGAAGRTPIVALTAHVFESDRNRCLEAGMDGFLAKPMRAAELMRALTRWARSRGND